MRLYQKSLKVEGIAEVQKFYTKEAFRKYCKQKRELSSPNEYLKQKKIGSKLLKLIKALHVKDILCYLPLQKEVNTTHLINTLRRDKNIYVPFMEGVSFKMVKFRLPTFKKKFNIKEPKNSLRKISKIDLAIVPVLGVDGALKRVGFGKGMYDRFFESLPCKPMIVFVQLGECTTREKLCESYDVQANLYLTPQKTIIQRGKDDNRNKYSCCRSNYKRCSRIYYRKKTGCSKL